MERRPDPAARPRGHGPDGPAQQIRCGGGGRSSGCFVSPLWALSAALFAGLVVHHVLLIVVAAPLLAMALRPILRPTLTVATGYLPA